MIEVGKTAVYGVAIATAAHYVWWRVTKTVDFTPAISLQFAFPVVFLIFEISRLLNDAFLMMVLTRTSRRTPAADAHERRLRLPGAALPRVDVFIPTYDEPEFVLARTIVCAKAMDYPHIRIFVLDDTARASVRALCVREGVRYVSRRNAPGAKAGNLNHALAETQSMEPAPFILVLDADFLPHRNFLYRTLGFFADDPRLALVQTPQYFFNPDPPQLNLGATRCWVDEQRFFFDVLQPSMDAWGVAFCVGTSCIWRREAIQGIGGVPTDSVVEDIHLSFKLREAGWKTWYLDERLSQGMAAESISEFVAQRVRWAIGCTQAVFLRYGPFRWNRLRLRERAQYLSVVLYWVNQTFLLLALLAAPLYWLLGVKTIDATGEELLAHLLPYVGTYLLYMFWTGRKKLVPVVAEAVQTVGLLDVLINVYRTLLGLKPLRSHVTAKGVASDRKTVTWRLLGKLLPLLALNVAAPIVGLVPEYRGPEGYRDDAINLLWSGFDIALILLAMLLCIELPRPRGHERFAVGEPVTVTVPAAAPVVTDLVDVSVNGAALAWDGPRPARIEFEWRGVGPIVGHLAHAGEKTAGFRLQLSREVADRLTAEIYTTGLSATPGETHLGRFSGALVRRMLERTR